MYAVIETGGKQYRVELGSQLAVERLSAETGETIRFERVLLVADGDNAQVGTPLVSEALVTAEVVSHDRGDKVVVFKYRPKARRRVKKGHRQPQTIVRVADIRINGRSAAAEASRQEEAERKTREKQAAEAERKAAADRALADKLAAEAKAAEEEEAKAAAESKPGRATTRKKDGKTAADKKSSTKAVADEGDSSAPSTAKRRTTAKADATAGEDAAAEATAAEDTAEDNEDTGRRTRRAAPKKDE